MTYTTPIVYVRIRSEGTDIDASFDNLCKVHHTFSAAAMFTWDDEYAGLFENGYPLFSGAASALNDVHFHEIFSTQPER